MHSVEEVLRLIERQVRLNPLLQQVAVSAAFGRILAQAVLLDSDSPPFDRAVLDGFAVNSADAVAGARLRIIGRQDAGPVIFEGAIGEGECLAINTGGVFPKGADAVLMVEHSAPLPGVHGQGEWVQVMKAVAPSYGVQRRGADAKMGQSVLSPGIRLGPAQLAAAVSAGAALLAVRPRVKVAVLTTGDELVAAGGSLASGQIRNSNHPMLCALVREALGDNGELLDLGTSGDERPELRGRLQRGLQAADLTIVTGGMSMGSKDLVPPVLKELGMEFHVEKVRMKPGKPFVFATRDDAQRRAYVVGLPGNPVSAFVTFHLFVRDILARLAGETAAPRWTTAQAASPFPPNGEREFFQPCTLERNGQALRAAPLTWRGSGDVFTLARAHALARRKANAPELAAGESLEILPL